MINVSGFKVFPREVEEKLYKLPFIEVCAVLGKENPERPGSELVRVVVQKGENYKYMSNEEVLSEIEKFSKEHLGAYKKPKIIEVMDEIPMTAAGKVDRKALR
jgi:long-chain acyl-CoA synthetase